MGRRPEPKASRLRNEWVYVGKVEAAVLAGRSHNWVARMIASGELGPWLVERRGRDGRCLNVYRLDEVLALARAGRR